MRNQFQKVDYIIADCSISDLDLLASILCEHAGQSGLEIFVMYDTGGATMMEAMVIFE